ncbi:MAG: microcin C ABC transporter permease YejB [Spirochaetaceae bacterium]|nr:microcin C ABC transporter permease YejB [Spirochaetaceae bacterium]MDT8296716.1 microcin C ABC transporter permease YejB [Spirochaetaceae bacterium]
MGSYILRRLLLIIPTLWAIITVNFFIVQVAPGGPVDQAIANARGIESNMTMERISGSGQMEAASGQDGADQSGTNTKDSGATVSTYRGARGLAPETIAEIEKRFGFDKPIHVRYFNMLKNYVVFNFGDSLFKGRSVMRLVVERMPVSISLGVWTTLAVYLVSIPLGIRKAVRDGSRFDRWSSAVVVFGNAVPSFLFAILLIVLFAGGSYLKLFPLRGLVSVNWKELSFGMKILDYFWHLALPLAAMLIGGFASLTLLTKNSFMDEIGKQYVMTARAKGLTEKKILFGHVFRNAMLLIIAGFPAAFIGMLFTGGLIIETIFSLNGLGLLGFEAVMQRDYPVMFGTLYVSTLLGLVLRLVSDLMYTIIDPRIDFERRAV